MPEAMHLRMKNMKKRKIKRKMAVNSEKEKVRREKEESTRL